MKKNILWCAVALLTALIGVSCSNVDDYSEIPAPAPTPSEEVADSIVTFTATLDAKGGSGMRAVNASGVTTWVENEEILVSYYNTSNAPVEAKATVESVDASGKATITASFVNPKEGSAIYFYYPYDSWKMSSTVDFASGQDGSLATLSQYFDYALDDSQLGGTPYYLSISGDVATLPSSINMLNQNAIWKFSFTDGTNDITSDITKLEIHVSAGGTTDYVITPTAPITNYFYVSMGGISGDDITITATTASGIYRIAKSGITLDEGKIYTSAVALKKVNIGDLFGADGNVYADAAAVSAAGTTAIGVVAFLDQTGTYNEITEKNYGGGHGLVLCLKNAASNVKWSTEIVSKFPGQEVTNADGLKRTENVSGYTNTATLTVDAATTAKYPAAAEAKGYTGLTAPASTTGWFLPSAQQWVRMMTGLGGLSEGDITWLSWYNNDHSAATAWENAMAKAGTKGTAYDSVTDDYRKYWSSSEFSDNIAVYLIVYATDGYGFRWGHDFKDGSGTDNRVRPVLAF